MNFLERKLKNAVSRAIGDAVEQSVKKAVQPAVNKAANQVANAAAQKVAADAKNVSAAMNEASASLSEAEKEAAGISGEDWQKAFSALNTLAESAAAGLKVCPSCGEAAKADQKFCPSCGAKLPEMTAAEAAVCPQCGKKNALGAAFCAECGTKLPGKAAADAAKAAGDAAVLAQWGSLLPNFPVWNFGGSEYRLESPCEDKNGNKVYTFGVRGASEGDAEALVRKYRAACTAAGFHPAGEYADESHLYNRIGGVVYHVDFEHCFLGDADYAEFSFDTEEPTGGYDYKKPEQKKNGSLSDLLGLFK